MIKMKNENRFTLGEVFSQHDHPPRKVAFTLAEVLITLGVIGVVAALTLPNLIQNYQKHVTVNRLKVNYNILSNAIRMAEAEYGDITSWEETSSHYDTDYSSDDKANAKLQAGEIVKKYILPYLSGAQYSETKTLAQLGYKRPIMWERGSSTYAPVTASGPILTLKNGTVMLIGISTNNVPDTGRQYLMGMTFTIDIDGPNGSNTLGKDVFMATVPYANNTKLIFFQNYGFDSNTQQITLELVNRNTLMTSCKTTGTYCGALIQFDGWQIKDDYPWW